MWLAERRGAGVCIDKWPVVSGHDKHASIGAPCQARDKLRSALAGATGCVGGLRYMTEIEAPTPSFTRRRVLAGVVGLGLGLAAAGLMFGWFDQTPTVLVTASFAGFTRSTDDGSYL